MYLPTPFLEQDASFVAAFIDRHPLATVVAQGHDGLVIDHIPFMREGALEVGHTLIAHAAKANPLRQTLATDTPAVLVFSGAGAYVSPSFYPSKPRTHEVVPTWNYVAIHLHGRLRLTEDDAEKRAIVGRLTDRMEATRSEPWKVTDAPTPYIDRMLQGIFGLVFQVGSIVAKTKASQNRLPEDRAGVVAGLRGGAASPEAADVAARFMPDAPLGKP